MAAPQRAATRVLGMPQDHGPVNPDDLIQRGYSQQQVDHIQVQRHQQEVLQGHLARWAMVFCCGLCILIPALLGVLIALILSWNEARQFQLTCDAPLIEWVWVVYSMLIYQLFLHKCIIRFVCGYDQQQQQTIAHLPPPARVRYFNMIFPVFDFGWKVTGIVLAATSQNCATYMPSLHRNIIIYAAIGISLTVFTLINAVGIATFVGWMMRNGMLSTAQAAPAGTLEAQSVVSASEVGGDASCSICLENFGDSKEIRKTQCGHCFHSKCLKGWLAVNHTCPLCREDLASPAQLA